ncbi:MAG TPA: ArsR family transcriptional regulator [Lacisediminihabitans sp.]|uniref:ArsR/SmtB family transcription factor n=1 Tax=Lacisediminihabitans sp. TaxID=2787631 RepID=UPI002EDB4397
MVVETMNGTQADRVFHALADGTRRSIVTRVILREQSVSALAQQYSMSFAAVQKHVAVLEGASLVTKQRRGREQIVRGNVDTLRRTTRLLSAYEDLWMRRAEGIEEILAEARDEE